jgi:hypothetical protein
MASPTTSTDLLHLHDSFVISRSTAFLRGKPVETKQIGRELGVHYMFEGSVRHVGETITVNARLISTETGAHVWADRFNGERKSASCGSSSFPAALKAGLPGVQKQKNGRLEQGSACISG